MGDVINLFGNQLGYPHLVCTNCNNDSFHVEVLQDEKGYFFSFVVCTRCEYDIPVGLTPCFDSEDEQT